MRAHHPLKSLPTITRNTQQFVEASEDLGGPLLSDGQSHCRVAASDLGFDCVEITNASDTFLGSRCGAGADDVDQLAVDKGPAVRKLNFRSHPV